VDGWSRPVLDAMRVRHWQKNLLVFLPLITGHEITNLRLIWLGGMAFMTFSLAASAGYLINDLHDVEADRRHPTKRFRPLAAATIPASVARGLVPVLLAVSVGVAWWRMPGMFVIALLSYIVASTAYSLVLKQILFLDVVVLTALYCLRIIAGGIATGLFVSPWLLGLSLFFFLSLALLKRYVDLREFDGTGEPSIGRAYLPVDADILRSVGPASGYLSVFLLVLYINSDQARSLYESPSLLWLIGPLLIYWITRLWLLANRGVVSDDVVEFASRDAVTYVVAGLTAVVLYAATVGLLPLR